MDRVGGKGRNRKEGVSKEAGEVDWEQLMGDLLLGVQWEDVILRASWVSRLYAGEGGDRRQAEAGQATSYPPAQAGQGQHLINGAEGLGEGRL